MKKIIFLATDCETTWMLYNKLQSQNIHIEKVILEQPISKRILIRRRIKKLGWFHVFGQLLFQLSIPKILKLISHKRILEIQQEFSCSSQKSLTAKCIEVQSVNDASTHTLISSLTPDIIIVNGTRIISEKTLVSTSATFINTHLGITPQYRGVHGGYWSLFRNDRSNFGATIHLVDKGIDTGSILKQCFTQPTLRDNFYTYPFLQMASTLNMWVNLLSNEQLPITVQKKSPSALYYHPTIWTYIRGSLRGIY